MDRMKPLPLIDSTIKGLIMTWRVIVRFSLNSDGTSALRNSVAALLQANGINRTTTGTWESAAIPQAQAAQCISSVLTQLANPTAVTGVNPVAHLDHVWVYMDAA